MSELHCLEIRHDVVMEEAWSILEEAGLVIAYAEEEDDKAKLYVFANPSIPFDQFKWVARSYPYELPAIDWSEQWKIHGMNFKDGLVHVDLSQFGGKSTILKLEPGPGFGDLSHPTTRLVLRLMARQLHGQPVVDVGCGSGILTLAAIAMGSSVAYGIDIDVDALEHSKKNAQLNSMESQCSFKTPGEFELPPSHAHWLIVMNMILSEQKMAWASLPDLHCVSGLILTSGITIEERDIYLKQTVEWGWRLQEEIEEDGWMAFCFIN